MDELRFLDRIKACYNSLIKSRVVNKGETDEEALGFFERFCNESVPRDEYERELRGMIKNMYHTDKTAFERCIRNDPYLILLTEARTFVKHFKVENLIYISWDGKSHTYSVSLNKKPAPGGKYHNNNKYESKKVNYKELLERIAKLEEKSKDTLEQVEPDFTDEKTENSENTESNNSVSNNSGTLLLSEETTGKRSWADE